MQKTAALHDGIFDFDLYHTGRIYRLFPTPRAQNSTLYSFLSIIDVPQESGIGWEDMGFEEQGVATCLSHPLQAVLHPHQAVAFLLQ